jgi:glycosyltransferase involved in cell wall biosynthesis
MSGLSTSAGKFINALMTVLRPVVCGNRSSLPEVAGDAMLLRDPRDVDSLAGAIVRVLTDRDLRSTLAQRGLARAAHFSWETGGADYA